MKTHLNYLYGLHSARHAVPSTMTPSRDNHSVSLYQNNKTFNSGSTHLQVKFDPSPSMHVAPLKHSETLKAASLQTSISFSQAFPVKPSWQKHAYLSMRSTHEPPFKQGLGAQSCEWKDTRCLQEWGTVPVTQHILTDTTIKCMICHLQCIMCG